MILVDTSVWIDHLRARNDWLAWLMINRKALLHPMILGELSLGGRPERDPFLVLLKRLPSSKVARDSEVLAFIDEARLFNLGIGYVDTHVLASVVLSPGVTLYTHDKKLHTAAVRLSVAANPIH